MNNHTKGPWQTALINEGEVPATELGSDGFRYKTQNIETINGDILAEVKGYTTGGFMKNLTQVEANARLIAAAPEMFEMLEQLQHFTKLPKNSKSQIVALLNRINQQHLGKVGEEV